MTKREAMKSFGDYMKNHHIPIIKDNDDGCIRYTIQYRADSAPDGYVESCIWFYEGDNAEVHVYYNATGAEICKHSDHRERLLQLLNYINARVFLSCGDAYGLYEPHMLYTPRMYLTVDDCYDLTITTIVNYDFWEVAPVETLDYMTCYCPELLDKLSYPVFGVLKGENTVEGAIEYIENNILR